MTGSEDARPGPTPAQVVRHHLGRLLEHLAEDPDMVRKLQDESYSRVELGLGWPMLTSAADIAPGVRTRYWTTVHTVAGKDYRVTSQWYDRHVGRFIELLERMGIEVDLTEAAEGGVPARRVGGRAWGTRYRFPEIGNAQNALIRNVLGRLDDESFSRIDWVETKADFGNRCAYCGVDGELVMDHGVPISIESMGEHRLGNLVPACHACNSEKGRRKYSEFLSPDDDERLRLIESHMVRHGYEPFDDDEAREILREARLRLADLADEVVERINALKDRAADSS